MVYRQECILHASYTLSIFASMKVVLFRSFLLLVFLGVLPVACCRQATRDYLYLKDLALELADAAGNPLASGARTPTPELRLTLQFRLDYVARSAGGAPFTNAAQAFQCAEEGSKGLKAAVAEVALTSTGLFNGQAAGQPLNAFVRCTIGRGGSDFPLAQLADSLNTKSWYLYRRYEPVVLRISPKPTDNARQQLQVRVRTVNGQLITQTAPAIIWE